MRTSTLLVFLIVVVAAAASVTGQSAPAGGPDRGWMGAARRGRVRQLPGTRFALRARGVDARRSQGRGRSRGACGELRFVFARDASKPRGAGEGYVVTDGGCTLPGGVEPNSAAFRHRAESRPGAARVGDPGLPRTIHLDGRVHPHLSRWTPTAVGHSVGRVRSRCAGRRDDWSDRRQRHGRRLADTGNGPDRTLPPVLRRQTLDDYLHLAGPEGVSQASHLRDCGRRYASNTLNRAPPKKKKKKTKTLRRKKKKKKTSLNCLNAPSGPESHHGNLVH